jgi:hypothetical protein
MSSTLRKRANGSSQSSDEGFDTVELDQFIVPNLSVKDLLSVVPFVLFSFFFIPLQRV